MSWSQVAVAFALMACIYVIEHWGSAIERVLENQLSMETVDD
jgi:hypothetical protein